jgi:hypothetical protein
MALRLTPHPAAPSPVRVEASVSRRGSTLALAFVATGDLDAVAWPSQAEPGRVDALWRTTCFEAFVRPDGRDGYVELNLSPSGRWAAYVFDGYRSGMRDLVLASPPAIAFRRAADRADLAAAVDLSNAASPGAPWRLGLSAVIEDADGRVAHLALAHAPDRPDFHHPAGFALELTADA